MGHSFAAVAGSGPLLLAVAVAALAGMASSLSPCVLPLVPGYLSYVTGLAGSDLDAGHRRGRVLAGSALFVAGFATVFVTVSVVAVRIAQALVVNRRAVEIGGGLLVMGLGAAYLGWVPGLTRQWRVRHLPSAGLVGAPVFGAVFALSWVPCVTPTLGAVLTLATVGGTLPRAVLLALAYCVGLGIPFVVVGLGFHRLLATFRMVRRHSLWVTRAGGALLMVVGIALVSGFWEAFVGWLRASAGVGGVSI